MESLHCFEKTRSWVNYKNPGNNCVKLVLLSRLCRFTFCFPLHKNKRFETFIACGTFWRIPNCLYFVMTIQLSGWNARFVVLWIGVPTSFDDSTRKGLWQDSSTRQPTYNNTASFVKHFEILHIVLDDYPFDTEYSNVMPYKSVHLETIWFCFFIFLLFFEI